MAANGDVKKKTFNGTCSLGVKTRRPKGAIAKRAEAYLEAVNKSQGPPPKDNSSNGISPDPPPTNESPAKDTTPAAPIDTEFLTALGDQADEKPTYGENIHQNLADRWLPILRRGLSTENRDSLLKELTIPENCKLLRAPTLNPEISAAISESARTRDKKFEKAQQQLGLGISTLNRALTLLVTGCEDKESKVKVIKMLSGSCRVLTDLHYIETQARIKAITPALDKAFVHVVENVERDESLFGVKLSDKIKASKTIEKQGLQIKKFVLPQSQLLQLRNRRLDLVFRKLDSPLRHQSSNRGRRSAEDQSSTYKTAPAPPAPPSTRSSSQSKRGARRN
ncbi:hypothetical protein NE865_16570 [Phthorimaea operculella]|nr:hypothetical protein NE865_16570 [Phthorimaea operculella]